MKVFRIRVIDQRGLSHAAGYYSSWQDANFWHDRATYECDYWKNFGIKITETIIEEIAEH